MIKKSIHMKKTISFKIIILVSIVCLFSAFSMTVFAKEASEITEMSAQGEINSDVNVRKGPSTDYDIIGTVREGESITITGESFDGWYRIEYQGGTGYIYGKYITVVSTEAADTTGAADTKEDVQAETVTEPGQKDAHPVLGILKLIAVLVIIAVIVVMIFLTIKSLRQMADDDDDDEDEDGDDDYGEDDSLEEEDDSDGDADKSDDQENVKVETAKIDPRTIVIREEDYQLHIDPKYFEDEPIAQPECVTGYLQKKQEEEAKARQNESKGNTNDLQKAMDKLQELQEEIEKLKKKQ